MSFTSFDRRRFLRATALGAGGLLMGGLFPKKAAAQAAANRKFVFAYFDGGWDILLGLDPRDPATTNPMAHQIDPAYGQLGAPYIGRGVQVRGNLSFGPAVPPEMLAHAADVSIVNAIGMDTASHEVGRRYFLTGRFPRGIAAVGSSTPAEIVAQQGDESPIPHISAGVESYATGLPSHASALTVNSLADLIVALTPFFQTDPSVLSAVEKYQDQSPGCAGKQLDRDGLSSGLLRNQKRAREYIRSQLSTVFDLGRQDEEMNSLRALYSVDAAGGQLDAPEVLSFVAGQALKHEVCQSISVRIASDLDTHSNWAQDHAPRQERGWRALAALISDLKATPSPSGVGGSLFDETTIVAFSEFGRTPMFNNLRGRDHFLGNSCLIGGAGVRRGRTIGRSAAIGMMPLETHLDTGAGVEMPSQADRDSGKVVTLSPKHVIATVLASAGLDSSYLRTPPIAALLP
jgi:hypothetical protein